VSICFALTRPLRTVTHKRVLIGTPEIYPAAID
jgi:hypothetical protein